MKTRMGLIAALTLSALLMGCAATGTKVTGASDSYKDMARSQGWWCGTFASSCQCSIDGVQTTCSLVQACLNSGNCKLAGS